MDIGKINTASQNYQTTIQKKGNNSPILPEDSFSKSPPADTPLQVMKNITQTVGGSKKASAGKTVKTPPAKGNVIKGLTRLQDLDDLGMSASKSTYDPKTKTIYTCLSNIHGEKKYHIAAFGEDGSLKWSAPGKEAMSDITFDDKGNLAYRTREEIVFHDSSGNEKWSFEVGWKNQREIGLPAPIIAPDETVYFCMQIPDVKYSDVFNPSDDNNMRIIAMKDGEEKWHYDSRGGVRSHREMFLTGDGKILINEERLEKSFFSRDNYNDHKILALNPDGKKAFTISQKPREYSELPNYAQGNDGTLYTSHGRNILSAYSPKGKEKWSVSLKMPRDKYLEDTQDQMFIKYPPVIDDEGNIFVMGESRDSQSENYLFCLDKDHKQKWRKEFSPAMQKPRIDQYGRLQVGSGKEELFILDRKTGNELIHLETKSKILSDMNRGDNGISLMVTNQGTFLLNKPGDLEDMTAQILDPNYKPGSNDGEKKTIDIEKNYVVIGGVKVEKKKKD